MKSRAERALLVQRLTSQRIAGEPASDVVSAARALLAVQAQDLRGAYLALRARTAGSSASDIDRALTEDGSLVVTWLNRGTLHLICTEDYHWLHALTAPASVTGNARRLRQEGVSVEAADRGVRTIRQTIERDGPSTRAALRDALLRANVPVAGQALVHLLMRASLEGHIVRGPLIGREHAYVSVLDRIGKPPEMDRDAALAHLARRYLAGHSPASDRDLARWAGIPLRDARRGLAAISPASRPDGLLEMRSSSPDARPPRAKLLGPWEPVLVGWTDRSWILGDAGSSIVSGGMFRPFALADGRPVATWSMTKGEPALSSFIKLTPALADWLERDANDVARFFG